jgi:hypothetical protein
MSTSIDSKCSIARQKHALAVELVFVLSSGIVFRGAIVELTQVSIHQYASSRSFTSTLWSGLMDTHTPSTSQSGLLKLSNKNLFSVRFCSNWPHLDSEYALVSSHRFIETKGFPLFSHHSWRRQRQIDARMRAGIHQCKPSPPLVGLGSRMNTSCS